MNYRISRDKHLRPDNYVSQHRLRIGNRVDKLGQHLILAAGSVRLVMAAAAMHSHPIPSRYSVEALNLSVKRPEKQNG